MTGNGMEITAPRGSMRLVAFPTLEEFPGYYPFPLVNQPCRRKMNEEEKLDYYCKKRKKFIRQQCKCIKAFMRQHRNGRHHGKEH